MAESMSMGLTRYLSYGEFRFADVRDGGVGKRWGNRTTASPDKRYPGVHRVKESKGVQKTLEKVSAPRVKSSRKGLEYDHEVGARQKKVAWVCGCPMILLLGAMGLSKLVTGWLAWVWVTLLYYCNNGDNHVCFHTSTKRLWNSIVRK